MIKKIINNRGVILSSIYIFMLIFNFMTPLIQDDYSFMYSYISHDKINDLLDVFVSLKELYFVWGGRVLAHFFTYVFMLLPKSIFNFFNSLIYVLNIYLIFLITKGKNSKKYYYILIIHIFVWLFFPAFGEVFFWLDGSCNYSFTLFFCLLFIYNFLNVDKVNICSVVKLSILGLLAGMCNENSSLSVLIVVVLLTILDKRFLKLKICSVLSCLIGYLFLFCAPGNFVRINTVGGASFFGNFFSKFFYLGSISFILFFAFLVILIHLFRYNKADGKIGCIFYCGALVSCYSMIASPQMVLRSFTVTFFYLLIILMKIWPYIMKMKYSALLEIILFISFIVTAVMTYGYYLKMYKFMINRHNQILLAIENKQAEVYLPIYCPEVNNDRIPVSCSFDISSDYKDFPNTFIAKYYGVERVIGYK